MGATKIEFRLRVPIMVVIITLGFWAPWIGLWSIGKRISLMAWLAFELTRLGLFRFSVAVPAVIVFSALIAAVAVVLRVWGTAWLGTSTVLHGQMKAGAVMADGPYRYVRNPLYLGSWCMFAAMTFVMPPSGALFAMALLTAFLLRLILGEEAFLTRQLGQEYQDYLRAVPRLIPRLRAKLWPGGIQPSGRKPQWLRAIISEVNPIGIFITMAFLSWSYDGRLMVRAIIVSLGVSFVVHALMPSPPQQHDSP
ncbi:MAG: isoprenylcysteine carboxylmethyltransferase family protein [Terracidiphilus sp.]|jgi:protein-S-isoprenylcysteine O-methyltransferase Ste14